MPVRMWSSSTSTGSTGVTEHVRPCDWAMCTMSVLPERLAELVATWRADGYPGDEYPAIARTS